MAEDVLLAFAGIGAIIFVGFAGSLLFERTKIPDILILIFIGLFLGPILLNYFGYTLVPSGVLAFIAPYFAALALVIILFDGGLNLNLDKVMSQLGVAILHTGIAFIGTMFVTALISYYFLGIDFVVGLLLGSILGGVSSAVVLPIMSGVSAKEETRTILTLESVLSDVLCIVTALILIEVLKGGANDTGALIQQLLSAFILAGVIGLLFGLAWLGVLKRVHGKPFSFMVTIAAVFILYASVEYIQVSGAIAALVFGLVLSNKDEVARMFKIKTKFVFEEKIKEFHSEVSFLVRTFFFVYLGYTFTFSFTDWNYGARLPFDLSLPVFITDTPMYMFLLVLFVIFIGIFIVRYIASSVSTSINEDLKPDKSFLYVMLPRGLAAAVLAALPFVIPEFDPGSTAYNASYAATIAPHQELFLNIAFLMIVITVIATTIGITGIEGSRRRKAAALEESEKTDWTEKSRLWKKHSSGEEAVEPPPSSNWQMNNKTSKPKKHIQRQHPPTPPPPSTHDPQKSSPGASLKTSKPHPLAKRAEEAQKRPPLTRKPDKK